MTDKVRITRITGTLIKGLKHPYIKTRKGCIGLTSITTEDVEIKDIKNNTEVELSVNTDKSPIIQVYFSAPDADKQSELLRKEVNYHELPNTEHTRFGNKNFHHLQVDGDALIVDSID